MRRPEGGEIKIAPAAARRRGEVAHDGSPRSDRRSLQFGLRRAVILDRDGTIIRERDFLSDPAHIRIYPGVLSALKRLNDSGWLLVIATNQSGIGRGLFSLKQ